MERKASEIDTTEIATAQQIRGMRAIYKQRMRDMVEVMVSGLEEIDVPEDHVGLDRMAKAMMSADKAIDQIMVEEPQEEDEMNEDSEDEIRDAVDAWRVILDRKLAAIAERRKAAGLPVGLDFAPEELARQLDHARKHGADTPTRRMA